MPRIHLLSPSLIAKIAAGEVIERPAYAVKELIDNSIDAGADTIIIHLEDSGLQKIIVHDNGQGMSKDDLLESYKLHTTSKISSVEQLHAIVSLGFRGEALSSIASVSDVIIQSRTKDMAVGTEVEIVSGNMVRQAKVGMPVGTTVIVSHLFSTTPGRKKFLKTKQTELRHILHMITHLAISHPEVTFSVFHNKKQIFFEQKNKNSFDRLHLLFSASMRDKLLLVSFSEPHIQLQGFISAPTVKAAYKKQFIYINNRHVQDSSLQQIVKNGYGSLLPKHRQPAFVLFLLLPHELVDVNIHPRKEQVGIANKEAVATAIEYAVRDILKTIPVQESLSGLFSSYEKSTDSFSGLFLRKEVMPFILRDEEKKDAIPMQIDRTFVVIPDATGFSIFDQHAVHERILYEQFSNAFAKQQQKADSFTLAEPVELDLPFIDIHSFAEQKKLLEKIGFRFIRKKDTTYLTAVPLLFQDRNYVELLLELLQHVESFPTHVDSQTHLMLSYLACRQAVKAGDILGVDEMKRLLAKLEKTENNLTCPHGRPTKINVSSHELYKVFQRR